jgi:preprotein translocase subunit SecD
MNNRYPAWKNVLLLLLVVFGVLYSLPNLYGEKPALQITTTARGAHVDSDLQKQIVRLLQSANIAVVSSHIDADNLVVELATTDAQTRAQEMIKEQLGDDLTAALYLMPTTPHTLSQLGAQPMRLGLDLRGGVHLLLSVDINAVFDRKAQTDVRGVAQTLREARIRYSGLSPSVKHDSLGMTIHFRDEQSLSAAYPLAMKNYPLYHWDAKTTDDRFRLVGELTKTQYQKVRQDTMDQTMMILRNRVNELGVSEAVVTQQGGDQVAVDLPGIQDAAQAQSIIGKTATIAFHLVDMGQDARQAARTGIVPVDDVLEYGKEGEPYLLKKDIILDGASISNASANFGEQGPEVNIRLSGGSVVSQFNHITAQHIGQLMGTVYIETKPVVQQVDGKSITRYKNETTVINAATITTALGNSFRTTGLTDVQEAAELALLLRAGSLPVPVHIIQERTIGPSLGQSNIDKGIRSVEIGFLMVIVFMTIYYRLFGFYANCALAFNLVLIVAVMSLLGAVMTLPGMAGIVLTVGMAVDANVLIFERIREELRNGVSPQAAIYTGYGRAMTTIVDANVTTLIVAIVLFSLGSGAVKGFAITLTIGLMTSMITAILGTRALVNLTYGNRHIKQLSIGITIKKQTPHFTERGAANS